MINPQPSAKAKSDMAAPVRKYPPTAMGLRRPVRSESQPPASFTKLETASEIPSMAPSAAAESPKICMKPGSRAVANSCPASDNRLVRPMPTTFRLSQPAADGERLVSERSVKLQSSYRDFAFCFASVAVAQLWTASYPSRGMETITELSAKHTQREAVNRIFKLTGETARWQTQNKKLLP